MARYAPATKNTEFFSIDECAKFFSVSTQVIHRWRGMGLFAEHGAIYEFPGGPSRKIVRFHKEACARMRASFAAKPASSSSAPRSAKSGKVSPTYKRF